jgi:dTDP-4-dehydrorhamnose 3,5-epimerase-like enzyme
VKRSYFINNSQKGVIRGFHYHQNENKYFVVLRGAAKFVTAAMSYGTALAISEKDFQDDFFKIEPQSFVLTEHNAQMLVVPPGYANGWMSLTDNCLLLAMSSSSVRQSQGDDIRLDPYLFDDVWSVKAR